MMNPTVAALATKDAVVAFPTLSSPVTVGAVTLRNRLAFGGHASRFIDPNEHLLTQRQADYLAERAKGGVGLVIQGSAIVHRTGAALPGMNQIWDDSSIPSYAMVADAVHAHGAKVFGQLAHLGRQGSPFVSETELWAPSAIPDPVSRVVPHAMTRSDIKLLRDAYVAGARRLVAAGFDGIEIMMCHGFLLSEFLSPTANVRADEYGGDLLGRTRFPTEVLGAIRSKISADVPLGIRISSVEFTERGTTISESIESIQHMFQASAIDFVNVTQGNYASMETLIPDMSFSPAPFVHFAGQIKQQTDVPTVMTVARIVTPERAESIVAGGVADVVCLVRPLIADPEFANKSFGGRRAELRECISCNVGCRGGPHRGVSVACLVNPAVGYERDWGIGTLTPVSQPKSVLVIGGGPAGLKAAETAALRGHNVSLWEAWSRLGGQVLVAAAAMPYRDEFANSTRHLERQLDRLGVGVVLDREADAGSVDQANPEVVIVATGSRPGVPAIPGADLDLVVSANEAIQRGVEGHTVVVVDSGEADWKCLTTAECLAAAGHRVVVVTPVAIGQELDAFSRPPMLRRLIDAGVSFVEHSRVITIADDRLALRRGWAQTVEWIDNVDAVVLAWYGQANDELFHELHARRGDSVVAVGDCLAPRRAIDAIRDGYRVGRSI